MMIVGAAIVWLETSHQDILPFIEIAIAIVPYLEEIRCFQECEAHQLHHGELRLR
jgi:hypothetical protein